LITFDPEYGGRSKSYMTNLILADVGTKYSLLYKSLALSSFAVSRNSSLYIRYRKISLKSTHFTYIGLIHGELINVWAQFICVRFGVTDICKFWQV
jgi:hypothetical protein